MYDENTKAPTTSDNSLAPALSYIGNKTRVKFDGGCLKQDKITTLDNSLFGAVKWTKKCWYW